MIVPMDGECIKDTFYLMGPQGQPPGGALTPRGGTQPKPRVKTCCGACAFKVFADPDFPNEKIRNDISGPHVFLEAPISTGVYTLQRFENGDWVDKQAITDNTLGNAKLFGNFKNDFNQNFVGVEIDWLLVQIAYDYGSYRFRLDFGSFLGNATLFSNEYCLAKFNTERRFPNGSDYSVKLEWYLNGILGVNTDDYAKRDYGELNWYNSVRLEGVFSYLKSEYTKDVTRYNDGSRPWVQHEQEPVYQLELYAMCWLFHELLRTDAIMADRLLITDYSIDNVAVWTQKDIQHHSGYDPEWSINRNKLAPIKLEFQQGVNNLKKRRC